MSSPASLLRVQIEAALANRIPSALTPSPKIIRPVAATGIDAVDEVLEGGLPLGAITEMVGPECSGRTSFALSFIARMTQAVKVCAWIDVSNTFDPESAAAMGADLTRLLWVRCGVPSASNDPRPSPNGFVLPEKYLIPPPITKGLHGGGPHPRGEVKGLSNAVGGLLRSEMLSPRCAEPQRRLRPEREVFEPNPSQFPKVSRGPSPVSKLWSRIDQALLVTDLLLQGGGFSAIVLDMGSIAPEYASRVPMATWFRYRAAAERTQASILLLNQHSCAKSGAGLVFRLHPGNALQEETIFTGIQHRIEIVRQRFTQLSTNIVPLRKPPLAEKGANWRSRTTWTGRR